MIEQNIGYSSTIGIDEVGRGALCGPVVACAFFLDCVAKLPQGVGDSKKISAKKRGVLAPALQADFYYAVAEVCHQQIDKINILQATHLAMQNALLHLKQDLEGNGVNFSEIPVLVDGSHNPVQHITENSSALIKGDSKSYAIAAASIIAKEYRDALMRDLAPQYPQYNLAKNAGYGTKDHRDAIIIHGKSAIHRQSFKIKMPV